MGRDVRTLRRLFLLGLGSLAACAAPEDQSFHDDTAALTVAAAPSRNVLAGDWVTFAWDVPGASSVTARIRCGEKVLVAASGLGPSSGGSPLVQQIPMTFEPLGAACVQEVLDDAGRAPTRILARLNVGVLTSVVDTEAGSWVGRTAIDSGFAGVYTASGPIGRDVVASPVAVDGRRFFAAEPAGIAVIDAVSGERMQSLAAPGLTPAAWDARGKRLLGLRWNGSSEELVAIDPASGATASIGSVTGLCSWNRRLAVDAARQRLYIAGDACQTGESRLWTMSFEGGSPLASVPIAAAGRRVVVPDGSDAVLALDHGTDGMGITRLVWIDPTTGTTSKLRDLPPGTAWDDVLIEDPGTGTVLVSSRAPDGGRGAVLRIATSSGDVQTIVPGAVGGDVFVIR